MNATNANHYIIDQIAREVQRVRVETGRDPQWLFVGRNEAFYIAREFGPAHALTVMGCRVMEVDASSFLRAAP